MGLLDSVIGALGLGAGGRSDPQAALIRAMHGLLAQGGGSGAGGGGLAGMLGSALGGLGGGACDGAGGGLGGLRGRPGGAGR